MKNIGKSYLYHEIAEGKNEVQTAWKETITMLITQRYITNDYITNLHFTGCNSLKWKTYKITCNKSCIKARKGGNDNAFIWIQVTKIFHLLNLENKTQSFPDEALFIQGSVFCSDSTVNSSFFICWFFSCKSFA